MKNVNRRQFLKAGLAGILGLCGSGCKTLTTVLDNVSNLFGDPRPYLFEANVVNLDDKNKDGKYDGSEKEAKNIFSPNDHIGVLVQNLPRAHTNVSVIVRDKNGGVLYAKEEKFAPTMAYLRTRNTLFQGINIQGEGIETYFVDVKIHARYTGLSGPVDQEAEKNLKFIVDHRI